MCAIIDANVMDEAFGRRPAPAAVMFIDWIDSRRGRLIVGGSKLRRELNNASNNFKRGAREALLSRIARDVNDVKVDKRTKQLVADGSCKSNDQHVIALAQLGGARLLYSNDGNLQQDFRDKRLVDNPRGQVYLTRVSKEFTPTHRGLLGRRDLCGVPQ